MRHHYQINLSRFDRISVNSTLLNLNLLNLIIDTDFNPFNLFLINATW